MKEQITPKGVFTLKVYKKGELVHTFSENNLVVVGGRTAIAKMIGGDTDGNVVTQIAFGESLAPANILDTALTNQYAKAITSATFPTAGQVDINWSLEEDEENGKSITEFGLLTASDVLFARKVREVIEKTADIRLEGKWQLIF
jgi:hypothetical protein